jgi:glycosyltransferase involved in cell wall biosynthesis
VRNGGALLEAAIHSLLDQSEQNIEIIVSDNYSEDGTGEYLLKLAQQDARIHYFKQDPPLRAYDNFQFVLSRARASYFMWAAHDDLRDLDFVAKLADELDRDKGAVLAFGDLCIITPNDKNGRLQPYPFSTAGMGRLARMKKVSQLQCFYIYGLWRSSILREIPYAYCPWWPDLPMMLSASFMGHFSHVNGPRFYYYDAPKTGLDRARYQDFQTTFNLTVAVLQLVLASHHSCRQVGGELVGLYAASLVVWKQILGFPGFLWRRVCLAFLH